MITIRVFGECQILVVMDIYKMRRILWNPQKLKYYILGLELDGTTNRKQCLFIHMAALFSRYKDDIKGNMEVQQSV